MKKSIKPVWLIVTAILLVILILCLITFVKLLTNRGTSGKLSTAQTGLTAATGDSAGRAARAAMPSVTSKGVEAGEGVLLDVVPLSQDYYESACEVYAAVSLLNYYGYFADDTEFVENYLHMEPISLYDGVYSAPSLYSAFAGTPELGYGVYSPSLESSINDYLSDNDSALRAKAVTGSTIEELCRSCVSASQPVIIWCTTDMELPCDFIEWVIDYADDNSDLKVGDVFSWPSTEHCMLLIGYDDENYIFADSLSAEIVSYPKDDCEKAFEALGSQAIVLVYNEQ